MSRHPGACRATPSRRVNLPRPDGGTRPLGVAALEDKIVRKAVASIILTPIYEAEFPGFSYGFRPGRGTHDALDALAMGIARRNREAEGDTILVRYADDLVAGFRHKQDAEPFLNDLKERLGRLEPALHPDKTRLIEFGHPRGPGQGQAPEAAG